MGLRLGSRRMRLLPAVLRAIVLRRHGNDSPTPADVPGASVGTWCEYWLIMVKLTETPRSAPPT
jgi:hypothetical protein